MKRWTGWLLFLVLCGCKDTASTSQLSTGPAPTSPTSNSTQSASTTTPAPSPSAHPSPTPSDSSSEPAPAVSASPSPAPTPSVTAARPSAAANLTVCESTATPVSGIDVSDYDTGTNWTTVQHSGVGFAFVKATEGITFVSPQFSVDWPLVKKSGLYRGAYHFYHPEDDPTAQAQAFLQTMGPLEADELPPMLDWEVSDGVAVATQISNAQVWLSIVEAATGKTPIIYVDPSFWNELGNPTGFQKYPLFIANYDVNCPSVPPPWSSWTFWQHGSGAVPGTTTSLIDLDMFNGSLLELSQFASGL